MTKGCGCPECYSKRRGHRKDGSRHKYPTLAECNHALLSKWDHNRNAEQGLFPEDITLGSHKPVHWVCHKCSLGILHRLVTTPNTHTLTTRQAALTARDVQCANASLLQQCVQSLLRTGIVARTRQALVITLLTQGQWAGSKGMFHFFLGLVADCKQRQLAAEH